MSRGDGLGWSECGGGDEKKCDRMHGMVGRSGQVLAMKNYGQVRLVMKSDGRLGKMMLWREKRMIKVIW